MGGGAWLATTLHVLPLQPTHALAQWHGARPHALLVCAHPGTLLGPQHAGQLAAVLGLTDAEARLALLLAQGRSVKDFAHAQGCTWHTARTHARNLLRKTGTNRQADLATLVRSLLLG